MIKMTMTNGEKDVNCEARTVIAFTVDQVMDNSKDADIGVITMGQGSIKEIIKAVSRGAVEMIKGMASDPFEALMLDTILINCIKEDMFDKSGMTETVENSIRPVEEKTNDDQ